MPPEPLEARHTLGRVLDTTYGRKAFAREAERVAFLFGRHQALTSLLLKTAKRGRAKA